MALKKCTLSVLLLMCANIIAFKTWKYGCSFCLYFTFSHLLMATSFLVCVASLTIIGFCSLFLLSMWLWVALNVPFLSIFFVSASSDCSKLPEWPHRSTILYNGSVAIPGSIGTHLYHNTGDWWLSHACVIPCFLRT